MTVLTTNQRLHLRKLVASFRPLWEEHGIDAAVVRLEQRVNDPIRTVVIALETAGNSRARLPEAMNHPAPTGPTAVQSTRPTVECPSHGGTAWRPVEGMFACCYFERAE